MIFGLPVEVVGGACAGLSASFFTLVELDNNYPITKTLFSSKLSAVILSTVISVSVGILVNPLAGIVFELCYYPACRIKVLRVSGRTK